MNFVSFVCFFFPADLLEGHKWRDEEGGPAHQLERVRWLSRQRSRCTETVHFLQCLEEALRNWSLARPVTEHRRTLRSPAKAEPGGLVLLGSGGLMWVMEIRLLWGNFEGQNQAACQADCSSVEWVWSVRLRGNEKTGFQLGISFWCLEFRVVAELLELFRVADIPTVVQSIISSMKLPPLRAGSCGRVTQEQMHLVQILLLPWPKCVI